MTIKESLIPTKQIERSILLIRDQKVILDRDLAKLYGVTTKRLNEQVKRNKERFPEDFMFQLNQQEKEELVANCDRFKMLKHSTVTPYAFTEHGVIMLASILNSVIAVRASIYVVRAFVKLRELALTNQVIINKLEKLEEKYNAHDEQIKAVFDAIRQLMVLPKKKKNPIGFRQSDN